MHPDSSPSTGTRSASALATSGTQSAPSGNVVPPSPSLPKGGGAVRGLGEKFVASAATGTATLSVPIFTSAGRSGFSPQLALNYDSGAGNGPFGLGWQLHLPAITRKTDKRLPRYVDMQDSDVFLLSGSEDLVPEYRRDAQGDWIRDAQGAFEVHEDVLDGYRVRRYRPRVEGLHARIERWARIGDAQDVHWRTFSRDNVLTLYGLTPESRVADPADGSRIFSWLICETRDDRGNAVLYRYKAEDGIGVALDQAHQQHRGGADDPRRGAARYLKRVFWGNRDSLLAADGTRPRRLDPDAVQAQLDAGRWMFELVFDYGEHDADVPAPRDDQARDAQGSLLRPWKPRPDAFSSHRAGFEVRTARRCGRALMFHHFPAAADVGRDCVVRSTDFTYADELAPAPAAAAVPIAYSQLAQVTQTGWRRSGSSYRRCSLPPLSLRYTTPRVQEEVRELDAESLRNLPQGLDGSAWRWVDLHGEGVPGLLTEQAAAWFYKRNLSPLPDAPGAGVRARFAPLERVASQPNASLLGGAEFMDLAGDGQPDVVMLRGPTPGLYEHDLQEGWEPFRPFTSVPVRNLRDPHLRLVDLDGDGHADLLVTEDEALVWHASLAEAGFGPARRVLQALDEEHGPRVTFADGTQSIQLADVDGDGLLDVVRIRNGEVCYWPNLGHGRFGAKVSMDHAPWFDRPEQFDPARLRLADLDGSGTTDIIYLHAGGVRLYFNLCGNAWSAPSKLAITPPVDRLAGVQALDLLGNGTSCLLWSSPAPRDALRPMQYVALMADKPHLLSGTDNNLGAETVVEYAPAVRFYLADRAAGRPWLTRLPFPVHVVERVWTLDHVARTRFCTRYAYHHGHYDAEEREFRGFGMVEQWDTEEHTALVNAPLGPRPLNADPATHLPPVHTKTWFHTGTALGRDRISLQFAREYFREPGPDGDALLLEDTPLPEGLGIEAEREACRALKGSTLRQEVYADDAPAGASAALLQRAATPYSVIEQNFSVRELQPRGGNRHGVYVVQPREALSFHYERVDNDPRVQHGLTLEVNEWGQVLKQAQVAYGRRALVWERDAQGQPRQVANPGFAGLQPEDVQQQTRTFATYSETRVTDATAGADTHRAPQTCEARSYQLTGFAGTGPQGRLRIADLVEPDPAVAGRTLLRHQTDLPFEGAADATRCRRLIEWSRTLYRADDLGADAIAPLPDGALRLGQVGACALPFESYKLAFTPGLLQAVYRRTLPGQPPQDLLPDAAAVLAGTGEDGGGYVASDTLKADGRFPASDPAGWWWLPSGRAYYCEDAAFTAAQELAQARRDFFQFRRWRDAFGQERTATLDADRLLTTQTRDPLGNTIVVTVNDYRVLQPREVQDPNGNRAAVALDALGFVVGTALSGKAGAANPEGDSLAGFEPDLGEGQLQAFFDAADPGELAPALLGDATTRVLHDIHRFARTRAARPQSPQSWQPSAVATIARDTHLHAPLPPLGARVQVTLGYGDGLGREIQQKLQAEPGSLVEGGPVAARRWVCSGWTLFNNKGLPVRQYEPFFTDTPSFEFGLQRGVSPVLFYDPAGRTVATLHPDHSYEKVVFDAWGQRSYDANDTVAARNAQTGDPRTDPDVAEVVRAHLAAEGAGWSTWHAERIHGALGSAEQQAALRAAAHADTPTRGHLDAQGHGFLSVARNRVVCPGHPHDGQEQDVATRTEFDIEGNVLAVHDGVTLPGGTRGRAVMRYAYDVLGRRLRQHSMDAGARWTLPDVAGQAIRSWDARGHAFRMRYDALRRLTGRFVRGQGAACDPRTVTAEVLAERMEFGESVAGAEALNLRLRLYRRCDGAGVLTHARLDTQGRPLAAYDFKGNQVYQTRQVTQDPEALADWSGNVALLDERFESSTRYDALNRAVQAVAPHGSLPRSRLQVVQPRFNEAGLLQAVEVWLQRAVEPAGLLDPAADPPTAGVGVDNIDYDARGRRRVVRYANGASTHYRNDEKTHRLVRLYTRRDAAFADDCDNPQPPPARQAAPDALGELPNCGLQNLRYTYDPAGNLTRIRDDAQQAAYLRNQRVDPDTDYVYDALYRLVQGRGRERLDAAGKPYPHGPTDAGRVGLAHPGDGDTLDTYVERYVHDAAGNLLSLRHRRGNLAAPGWTRDYAYEDASLLEDGGGTAARVGNRLTRTTLSPDGANPQHEPYQYDVHGNLLRMPHLNAGSGGPSLHWDHSDRLRRVDLGGGGVAFCVYDAGGERVRKVWRKSAGLVEERIYLGGCEVFRRHEGAAAAGPLSAASASLERETLHVSDDQRRIALVETRTLDVASSDDAPARLVRYQFGNHLGSACLELDDQAGIISYEEYAPYGSTTYQARRSQKELPRRYRFTGKERDEETGLYYHGARYYAPWLGRWTGCDPMGVEATINGLAYGLGNPLRFVDPSGMQDEPTPTDKYGWPRGSSFVSPPNTATGGTLAHKEVLPTIADRINKDGWFTADFEVETLPGGSKRPGSNSPGEIDLRVHGSTQGNTILDLKPKGGTEDAKGQTTNYALHDKTVFSSKRNTRPVTDFARNALDPVEPENTNRTYLLSQDSKESPEKIEYYRYDKMAPKKPVVEKKPAPLTPKPPPPPPKAAPVKTPAPNANPLSSGSPKLPAQGTGGLVKNVGSNVGLAIVPGAGEGMVMAEAAGLTAYRMGMPRLAAAAMSGAKAPGPAIVGGIVGAPAGHVAEGLALNAGMGEKSAIAVGTTGAVATGALVAAGAVLLVATAPVSLTVLAGAAVVGGLAAGFGYLTSRAMQ